jgi:hypothetical protein
MRSAYNTLLEKLNKIELGRPNHRWEYNIGIDLREIGWEGVDWMHLTQDRDQWHERRV